MVWRRSTSNPELSISSRNSAYRYARCEPCRTSERPFDRNVYSMSRRLRVWSYWFDTSRYISPTFHHGRSWRWPKQILEDHRRLEDEPCARLERRGDGAQEGGVSFVIQVAEAVPDTEGAVEAAGPRQIPHLAMFPVHAIGAVAGSGVLEELARHVHARETVTALSQGQRQPAASARHVQQFGARRCTQQPGDRVGFAGRCAPVTSPPATVSRRVLRRSAPTSSSRCSSLPSPGLQILPHFAWIAVHHRSPSQRPPRGHTPS